MLVRWSSWLFTHWQAALAAIVSTVGGTLGIISYLTTRRDRKLARQTEALGQILCVYADGVKIKTKTQNVEFSAEELTDALGKDGPRFHAAIDHLRTKGRAKKSSTPGYWIID